MEKNVLTTALAFFLALTACGVKAQEKNSDDYKGINVVSPDWVGKLDAAKDAEQLFVVAAFRSDATGAWISLHEKQKDGSWRMVMTTPGFVGRNGVGEACESVPTTPRGVFRFNRAFGIADDPGCAIPYVKADNDTYWSCDPREGGRYNQLVNAKELPEYDFPNGESEHIVDYVWHYQYCLNISYNEEGVPGKGAGFFLHCFGPVKPFTAGCVAIPKDVMKFVMRRVDEKTVVVIDSYEALAGTDVWPDSTWPQER